MEPIAVTVDLPGQKPCYYKEYRRGINLFNLNVNNLIIILYQIEVTEIDLSWLASDVGLSGLGMAVSNVVSKSTSILPCTRYSPDPLSPGF